ncbi:hypothetical protein DNFV4_02961 [Nitrospira tepida]|uniref:Uncharacterized protein n=1 Tax=Nitrospira tepida TaxID=2973512 RepID=A0AA86N0R3_9BACT|nr:hypothetical protein DNFV4_02961 [Nitrospira tepida]
MGLCFKPNESKRFERPSPEWPPLHSRPVQRRDWDCESSISLPLVFGLCYVLLLGRKPSRLVGVGILAPVQAKLGMQAFLRQHMKKNGTM